MNSQNEHKQGRRKARPRPKGRNNNNIRPGSKKDLAGPRGMQASLTKILEPWLPVFPPSVTKRLRYSQSLTLSSGALGAIGTAQVFRANDLFDPDFTGTGHQPMGFDQLMTWYNHFCVLSAKLKCTFKNISSAIPTVCIRYDGDNSTITSIDRVVELGGCVLETLEVKGVYGTNKTIELDLDIAKLQGVSRMAITSDPNLQGNAAASPTEVTYFHVMCWDTGGTAVNLVVDCVLEQTAVFLEPRDLTSS